MKGRLMMCGMLLGVFACRPPAKRDEAAANSILGIGGSSKEWKSGVVKDYKTSSGPSLDNPTTAEQLNQKEICSKFAQGRLRFDGLDVADDFKKYGGCGLGCDPLTYTFVGSMKAVGSNTGQFGCMITPQKRDHKICLPVDSKYCCKHSDGTLVPSGEKRGPYVCLPNGTWG